jgi:hypothetical protein
MSKIPVDRMKSAIGEMLKIRKPRKFVETIDLQIGLKVNHFIKLGLRSQ